MSNGLDIVVSFDSTGSMYPALAEVRRKVEEFINTLFDTTPNLRMGIIAHGDYCDAATSYVTKKVALTDDRNVLARFVQTVDRTGGGDSDECYELVLNEAWAMDWRSDAKKVFILIGDAEPHEVGYTFGTVRVSLDWRREADRLMSNGVMVYPVQALAYRAGRMYQTLATMSNTPYLKLEQFANVTQLLTAITYKQESDERVQQYGKELQDAGQLDRGLAEAFNLLLNATNLIGGVEYSRSTSDLQAVSPGRFQMLHVDHNTAINDFVRSTGATFRTGKGFYELTKTELVQERKEVVLRNDKGDMFSGSKAREMIGLPYGLRGKVRPMKSLGYDVFIQSTSANRKLIGGTRFLYETDYM